MVSQIIEIDGLNLGYESRSHGYIPILRDVNISLAAGESLGLVGESGCGKSTLLYAMMGYFEGGIIRRDGNVRFSDIDLLKLSSIELRRLRGGRLAIVPQNAGQALTPTMRVGSQLAEALSLHTDLAKSAWQDRSLELLEQVRLPDRERLIRRYPHELSGGEQQRVAIAMALAGEPELLLLDEPTTGLDVTTQIHILELLNELASTTSMSMIYVSHDLGVISQLCERIAVMYAGEVMEVGTKTEVLQSPIHPYTRGLLRSIPRISNRSLPQPLPGRPPEPGSEQSIRGCAFAGRCDMVIDRCLIEKPTLHEMDGHYSKCHRFDEMDPWVIELVDVDAVSERPDGDEILKVKEIKVSYAKRSWFDRLLRPDFPLELTVDGASFEIGSGEILGLVGESGSGKSTILRAIAGLHRLEGGEIRLHGEVDLNNLVEQRQREVLKRVQLVFQNPDASLNPRHTIREILARPLMLYHALAGHELDQKIAELLISVSLSVHYSDRLPAQLSGGEKQRVAIARAFAADPELILCDEITSALDVSVQASVLELLMSLKRQKNTAYLFVSHDLAVIRTISDKVAVLRNGKICEYGDTEEIFNNPKHPYTQELLAAVAELEA